MISLDASREPVALSDPLTCHAGVSRFAAMTRRVWFAATVIAMFLPAVALGQAVYKWKDSRGVIHFSDEAPPNVQNVEKRAMEPQPPLVVQDEQAGGEAAETPAPEVLVVETPETTGRTARSQGPAQVVVQDRKVTPDGPQTRHVTGKVKNVGGKSARRVGIVVTVTDADQGSICLRTEASVGPDILAPGETGSFDEYVDTPCFLGNFSIDIAPVW